VENTSEGLLQDSLAGGGPIVFLTGAGISAESGIPTFRGAEGYWQVGSRNYQPMEMATRDAFEQMPEEVWRWYLYRRAVCRAAEPNAAHRALVEVERALGDRFLLVTQNVDGLHLRAGHRPDRVYQIHGNIDFCRCYDECPAAATPRALPDDFGPRATEAREHRLTGAECARLRCGCGAWMRPHVLWFDESYDEERYHFISSLDAAGRAATPVIVGSTASTMAAVERAAALVVIGTSGATTLPARMCDRAAARGIPFLVLDPEETAFSQLARSSPRGAFLRGPATRLLPAVVTSLQPR